MIGLLWIITTTVCVVACLEWAGLDPVPHNLED
jgi:hypothetical protein